MDEKLPNLKTESSKETIDLSEYQKRISFKLENILNDKTLSTSFFLPSNSIFEPSLMFSPIKIYDQLYNLGIFYNSQSMNFLLDCSTTRLLKISNSKDLYRYLAIDALNFNNQPITHGTIVDISSYHFNNLAKIFVEKPHFWVISSHKFSFTFFLGRIKTEEDGPNGQ